MLAKCFLVVLVVTGGLLAVLWFVCLGMLLGLWFDLIMLLDYFCGWFWVFVVLIVVAVIACLALLPGLVDGCAF